jgi:LacI family transcriptional regulator
MQMKKRRITLNDVAKHAGVSRSTASLVVQESPKIKPSTTQKVLNSMRELGYVYDRMAANMRAQKSTTIGIIITDVGNPYYTDLLKALHTALEDAGYTVFLATTYDDEDRQNLLIGRMLEHRVSGMIICPVSNIKEKSIELINHLDIPVVMAVRENLDIRHDYIGIDYEEGMYLGTKHLLEKGHTNIAFIGGHAHSVAWQQRMIGFKKALEESHIDIERTTILETDVTREASKSAVLNMLATGYRPSAIVCFNDLIAHGVMLGLGQAGIKVGEDIALIGFDNTNESSWFSPALTTVSSFPSEIGNHAAELLKNRLNNENMERQRIILQPELVVRDTCKGGEYYASR